MRALVKDGPWLGVRDVPAPQPGPGDVVVRVATAGLCRTDLHVARGRLAARSPLVLGHEASGVLAAIGASVTGLRAGERVGVVPFLACGACVRCRSGAGVCGRARQLGVHEHGAFADFVRVPASCVRVLPPALSLARAAWMEPVAAALAVTRAPIGRGERGLVFGENRIATLTAAVLRASGFTIETGTRTDEDAFDFAIETDGSAATIDALLRAVKPGGTIVLKSRPAAAVPIDVRVAVHKDLRLVGAGYAPFEDALELLAGGALELAELQGPVCGIEAFSGAFDAAEVDERTKHFFLLDPSLR